MPKQKPKPNKRSKLYLIEEILDKGDFQEVRALFAFNQKENSTKEIVAKFNIWSRWFFPDYFKFKDALFHKVMDYFYLAVYLAKQKYFVNVVFRGGTKTTRAKLFVAFALCNDEDKFRRYIKVLCKDIGNASQFTTDVYNMLISERVRFYWPELFEKTPEKREERMSSFTTATGVKVKAESVGTDQRGDIQEDARPDFIIFDDIENRKTLRSAVETKAIWDNMEEARTGLSKNGGAVYLGNYLSERGNIHKLLKPTPNKQSLVVPIKKNGKSTWPSAYTMDEIKNIEEDADDFAGEYMCEPSAGVDIFFDRDCLKKQITKEPLKIVGEFKMFYNYDPSHRYGSGHDVGGGVGLDASTSVFIDFSTRPNRVVATFKSNTIKPDVFGDEIAREANYYGEPVVAPEKNNQGYATIGRLKQIYQNIYFTLSKAFKTNDIPIKEYGWHTNAMTKPQMLFSFKKAVEDGYLELTDANLITELKSYTRDDLMDKIIDPRLTTRHFDLLMACAIAWQMKNFAEVKKKDEDIKNDYVPISEYEGRYEEDKGNPILKGIKLGQMGHPPLRHT